VDTERRRKYDHLPQEVKDYIDIAASEGAKEALVQLGAEIARAGLKKVLYAVGVAVVGVLSAVTAWITTGHPPK
jgi:hypothetical protein